jgi:hypothetical protein
MTGHFACTAEPHRSVAAEQKLPIMRCEMDG